MRRPHHDGAARPGRADGSLALRALAAWATCAGLAGCDRRVLGDVGPGGGGAPTDGGLSDRGGAGGGAGAGGAGGSDAGMAGGAAGGAAGDRTVTSYFDQSLSNDLDLLFMIDDSSSMTLLQQSLARSFPALMSALEALPAGLPNLHIGIVSSSLGAGAYSDVPGCPPNGERGAFQNAPRGKSGRCTAVPKDKYIVSLDKGTNNNFEGDISDVFACIAELGSDGCGFEHQLAATARALGGNLGGWTGGAPRENAGFLRNEALLALVLVSNEDDCSAPVESDLFNTKQNAISDPLGPLNSFRCNEFGHLCGGVRPPRSAAFNLEDCHSAEDAGKLIPVRDFVSFFKTLKRVPSRVVTAAIAAPPTPYSVVVDGAGNPEMAHSCTSGSAFGDPAVRLNELVSAFGANGSFSSICDDTFEPALGRVAQLIARQLGTPCIDAPLEGVDASGAGADCRVVDQTVTDRGTVSTPLPSCLGGAPPCWRLTPNDRACPASGFALTVDRGGGAAPANTVTRVTCATCADPADPACAVRGSP